MCWGLHETLVNTNATLNTCKPPDPAMLRHQGATYATSQTLVEFKDSALHSLDGTVNAVQARLHVYCYQPIWLCQATSRLERPCVKQEQHALAKSVVSNSLLCCDA